MLLTGRSFAAVQVVFVGQALDDGPKQVVIAGGSVCQACPS